ncbi:hypothetical protein PCANC_10588 [Puccinia coronata f. sp. avenae]|uniref:Uncharacterized protein n=1 Tax=Puccinia coronata f. sp. avenae TaxID=200324 RepID=A0A2N5SRI6_9BASI|nr:hypothetical protein PCANC_20565 [Puccinia coronata f. sp. avenae]PLW32972.1 hypothetical protein PCASD_20097 [Puccinia coronata f. sp. avenae]PLW52462.1 hypothetical protein PCANC_10588 [Puccinia coronata f. sp. avenae]
MHWSDKQRSSEQRDQSKDISAPAKSLTSRISEARHKPSKSQQTNKAGLLVTRISLVTSSYSKRQDRHSNS